MCCHRLPPSPWWPAVCAPTAACVLRTRPAAWEPTQRSEAPAGRQPRGRDPGALPARRSLSTPASLTIEGSAVPSWLCGLHCLEWDGEDTVGSEGRRSRSGGGGARPSKAVMEPKAHVPRPPGQAGGARGFVLNCVQSSPCYTGSGGTMIGKENARAVVTTASTAFLLAISPGSLLTAPDRPLIFKTLRNSAHKTVTAVFSSFRRHGEGVVGGSCV